MDTSNRDETRREGAKNADAAEAGAGASVNLSVIDPAATVSLVLAAAWVALAFLL